MLAAWLATPGIAHASAEIIVGGMYPKIEAGQGFTTRQIRNIGDQTAFVRVDAYPMSGTDERQATPIDPSGKDGLLLSPTRLIIPVGGSQTVRMIAIGERVTERRYRVRFVPVAPLREHGFDIDPAAAGTTRAQASIEVLVGYGALLTVSPAPSTTPTRKDSP